MSGIALLANPDSGSGGSRGVERLLRDGGATVTRFGLDERHEIAAVGAQRIVVAGGDGSVACAAEVAGRLGVPLAVVAVGTANDFARAMGLPDDPARAVALALSGTRTRALELGRADARPFVNAASAGLSPVAARKAHSLKRALGPLAYTVGALRAGLGAQPIDCRVRCDGEQLFSGSAWQVSVACTGAFGGGAGLDADPDDGMLHVVAIRSGSRARLVRHAYGMRAGRVEDNPDVLSGQARRIEVETEGETGFNVDGELLETRRLRFSVEPRAFELVVG